MGLPSRTHMKWDFHWDHHGGAPWQHMNLSWWTRVWLPNASYEPDHEILGSGRETCLGTTLSVTPQKPFGTTFCHPAFPSGQLDVVAWGVSRQLKVIYGVTLCCWVTSYNGGQWVSRPWTSKSSQFRLSSRLVLVNLDLDSNTIPNELGDLVLTLCCGMC